MIAMRAQESELESYGPDSGWLTLPEAACELGVSVSTVRRLLRKGQLPNRTVPRRGGIAYLVHLPQSRHARGDHPHLCSLDETGGTAAASSLDHAAEVHRLELQIELLSRALSGKLRAKQRLVPGRSNRTESAGDPYARYRWLVRRHRWWPF